jgi:hydrogenase expression/formation protein HypC
MCLAIPGRLLDVQGEDILERRGRVSFGGVVKVVCLSCVPEAKEGDFVLVHVGVAIGVIDAEEAGEVFQYLRTIGDLADLADEPQGSP